MQIKDLHLEFMYMLWCHDHGYHMSLDESRGKFNLYLHDATEHRGDCTKDPCPCLRCHKKQLEIEAQCEIDHLEYSSKGSWFKLIELRNKK